MKLEANFSGDVSLLKQTVVLSAHAAVDLPHNPYPIYRCLSDKHADDCNVMDHINVLDASFDVQFE